MIATSRNVFAGKERKKFLAAAAKTINEVIYRIQLKIGGVALNCVKSSHAAMKLHKTKGIVLRTVKYGDTSLIATIYTELFGTQSYLLNGIRKESKKGGAKSNMFQPASLLQLVVYHNELKQLNRIKEFNWAFLYQHIFFDVRKNSVALFMIELLQKCLRQPEENAPLYSFIEDAFIHLDDASEQVTANFPLFFSLHFMVFIGFRMDDNYGPENTVLDLREGSFRADHPDHHNYLEGEDAFVTSQILKVMQPAELEQLELNQSTRRRLLHAYQQFYALHVAEFGVMKSVAVLQEVLG